MTDTMTDVKDTLPEPYRPVLLYVAYRDAELLKSRSSRGYIYEPEFHLGYMLPKNTEKKADSLNLIEEDGWYIEGWSYSFKPEVLYWCELPPTPSHTKDHPKDLSAAIADSTSDAKRECAYSGYDVMA